MTGSDDVIATLSSRVSELSKRLGLVQSELDGANRRLASYEEHDKTIQDALSGALRAAYSIRERAEVTAAQILEQAREERRLLLNEIERLRDERDALQDEIATQRRSSIAAVTPRPLSSDTVASELRAVAGEALRGLFQEIVDDMRATTRVREEPRVEPAAAPPAPTPAAATAAPAASAPAPAAPAQPWRPAPIIEEEVAPPVRPRAVEPPPAPVMPEPVREAPAAEVEPAEPAPPAAPAPTYEYLSRLVTPPRVTEREDVAPPPPPVAPPAPAAEAEAAPEPSAPAPMAGEAAPAPREAPATPREAPPIAREAPPFAREAPPIAREAPPIAREAPPMPREAAASADPWATTDTRSTLPPLEVVRPVEIEEIAPARVEAATPTTDIQVVLSPVGSFPRLVEIERHIQALPVVRTLYVRDFRGGAATLAVALRSAMTPDEFAGMLAGLQQPRLRLVSGSRNTIELRIEGEAGVA